MTFQQLEYIVAVDNNRHFVKAATACGVTQSTLSTTISKLEQEIDVVIFDRSKHPIEPTPLGKQIIGQARVILHNSQQLRELVQTEKDSDMGNLFIGIIPSVAPYLYPAIARSMRVSSPNLYMTVTEAFSEPLIDKLQRSELDMAIVSSSEIKDTNLYEIELYTERFMLYVSPSSMLWQREWLRPEDLHDGGMWAMRAFHDHYPQLADITHCETFHHTTFASGTLRTLIDLVNTNGGYTIVPELFRTVLSAEEQKNLRPIQGPKFFRTVSLVIRGDYLRERMLNAMTDAIKAVIPREIHSRWLQRDHITL